MTTPDTDWPYPRASLAQLARLSDLVVVGTVDSWDDDVEIGGDTSGTFTVLTVKVATPVSGPAPSTVKVGLRTHIGFDRVVVPGLPVPRIGTRAMYFLTRTDPQFDFDGYGVTNNAGILPIVDGTITTESVHPAALEAARLHDLDAVIAAASKH